MTMRKTAAALVLAAGLASRASAATTVPNTFTAGTPARAAEVNANFQFVMDQIAATAASYCTTTAYSIPASTPTTINFDSRLLDTDNAVATGSNWAFTVPAGKAGLYFVTWNAGLNHGVQAATGSGEWVTWLQVNGGTVRSGSRYSNNLSSGITVSTGTWIGRLNVGDKVSLAVWNGSGAHPLDGSEVDNQISILRVPGS
jgi:hypothetical protein